MMNNLGSTIGMTKASYIQRGQSKTRRHYFEAYRYRNYSPSVSFQELFVGEHRTLLYICWPM